MIKLILNAKKANRFNDVHQQSEWFQLASAECGAIAYSGITMRFTRAAHTIALLSYICFGTSDFINTLENSGHEESNRRIMREYNPVALEHLRMYIYLLCTLIVVSYQMRATDYIICLYIK